MIAREMLGIHSIADGWCEVGDCLFFIWREGVGVDEG